MTLDWKFCKFGLPDCQIWPSTTRIVAVLRTTWVVEANPEPIRERQSGNPEGFSNPGEPRRIPIRKKTQSGARKSQSGPGLNSPGLPPNSPRQLGDCGLVATTTPTATTTIAAANLVIAIWWLRPRQRLRPRLLRLNDGNLVIAVWWLRPRQRLRPRLLRLNDDGDYDVGDGDDCGGHGHDC